jgi:Asp-tRNA(Asn)/Glu-tRNA(Gln) amidotransferase A subunit family amidase
VEESGAYARNFGDFPVSAEVESVINRAVMAFEEAGAQVRVDPLIGWCLTYPIKFSGHPAASISAGVTETRLPVGMQIVGKRYADHDVLTASSVFEQFRPWYDLYEICKARPF